MQALSNQSRYVQILSNQSKTITKSLVAKVQSLTTTVNTITNFESGKFFPPYMNSVPHYMYESDGGAAHLPHI